MAINLLKVVLKQFILYYTTSVQNRYKRLKPCNNYITGRIFVLSRNKNTISHDKYNIIRTNN